MILIEGNAVGGARRDAGRRDRRRVVSDYAVVVAARNADQLPSQVPDRQDDGQGDVRGRAGGGRDRGDRHGRGRGLGRRPRDDVHVGPGNLADGGVRRPRVLRRSARRHLRHAARRPVDGLPTRTAQGDILSTALLSHGDTKQILLIPAAPEECYTFAMDAFDLAERFQTLVFVMSDLDLGMNTWMAHAVPVSGQAARPRQAARRSHTGEARRAVGTLQGRRRRRHPVPDDPGRRHAVVLHARLRPQRARPIQRAARRLRAQRRSARAEVRDGQDASCRRQSWTTRRPTSASSATARATGRSTSAAISCVASRVSRPAICGSARIRSPNGVRDFVARYRRVYVVEQNRDAQMRIAAADGSCAGAAPPSCEACCTTTACRSTPDR